MSVGVGVSPSGGIRRVGEAGWAGGWASRALACWAGDQWGGGVLFFFFSLSYFLSYIYFLSNCFCFVNHIVSTKISNSSYTTSIIMFVVIKISFQ